MLPVCLWPFVPTGLDDSWLLLDCVVICVSWAPVFCVGHMFPPFCVEILIINIIIYQKCVSSFLCCCTTAAVFEPLTVRCRMLDSYKSQQYHNTEAGSQSASDPDAERRLVCSSEMSAALIEQQCMLPSWKFDVTTYSLWLDVFWELLSLPVRFTAAVSLCVFIRFIIKSNKVQSSWTDLLVDTFSYLKLDVFYLRPPWPERWWFSE